MQSLGVQYYIFLIFSTFSDEIHLYIFLEKNVIFIRSFNRLLELPEETSNKAFLHVQQQETQRNLFQLPYLTSRRVILTAEKDNKDEVFLSH